MRFLFFSLRLQVEALPARRRDAVELSAEERLFPRICRSADQGGRRQPGEGGVTRVLSLCARSYHDDLQDDRREL